MNSIKHRGAKVTLNTKFGKLVVLQDLGKKLKVGNVWLCRCDCGKETRVNNFSLISGHSQSCGCERIKHTSNFGKIVKTAPAKLKGFEPLFREIYYNYKRCAKSRSIEFNLTQEEISIFVVKECFYCGATHSKILNRLGLELKSNTIDRLDSRVGYIVSNCVPCCIRCNESKMSMESKDFFNKIKEIQNNIVDHLTTEEDFCI
jgi:hypothetical protein